MTNRSFVTDDTVRLLRISLTWAIGWVLVMSILVACITDPYVPIAERMPVLQLIVLFFLIAYVTWVGENQRPILSRWFLVASTGVLIILGVGWIDQPAFLILAYVPVLFARMLIGLRASAAIATFESLLLLLVPHIFAVEFKPLVLAFSVVSLWTSVGLMFAAYRPMYQVTSWAMENYSQARLLLEEARDRRVELLEVREELLRLNRELSLSTDRLRMLRSEADDARKAKEAFVANVSHELRTPINMIIGLVDLIGETPEVYGDSLPESLLQDIDIIKRNCAHLSRLVNDVLNLGRMEAGMLPLKFEWVDLHEDIHQVITIVRPLLEKKGLYFETRFDTNLPQVYCDGTRIRQVILNLMSNAVRFTQTGGITISTAHKGDDILISVTDTGAGILPQDQGRIFEPFFQSTTQAMGSDGSGLGLSISRNFIEMHRGSITVDSVFGSGATFTIQIPVEPPSADSFAPQRWLNESWQWQQRKSTTPIPRLPDRTRIVLCDSTKTLQSITPLFRSSIEFVEVETLEGAKQKLASVPAHLLIVNTPVVEDLLTLAQRFQSFVTDTPIVICSYQNPVKRAIEAGAVDYITKPVQGNDLFRVIDALNIPIRRIMVVDDNEDIQKIFSRSIKAHLKDVQIINVCKGEDAIQEMCGHLPDVVLLDLMMPNMNGWEILAQKMKMPVIKDIPTIIVSSQELSDHPLTSTYMAVAMHDGLSPKKLFEGSIAMSKVLLGSG